MYGTRDLASVERLRRIRELMERLAAAQDSDSRRGSFSFAMSVDTATTIRTMVQMMSGMLVMLLYISLAALLLAGRNAALDKSDMERGSAVMADSDIGFRDIPFEAMKPWHDALKNTDGAIYGISAFCIYILHGGTVAFWAFEIWNGRHRLTWLALTLCTASLIANYMLWLPADTDALQLEGEELGAFIGVASPHAHMQMSERLAFMAVVIGLWFRDTAARGRGYAIVRGTLGLIIYCGIALVVGSFALSTQQIRGYALIPSFTAGWACNALAHSIDKRDFGSGMHTFESDSEDERPNGTMRDVPLGADAVLEMDKAE